MSLPLKACWATPGGLVSGMGRMTAVRHTVADRRRPDRQQGGTMCKYGRAVGGTVRRRAPFPTVVCIILLAGTLAAGCLGDNSETASPAGPVGPGEDPRPDPAPAGPPPMAPAGPDHVAPPPPDQAADPAAVFRLPLDASYQQTAWHNGSFAPEETGLGGGFVTGAFAKHIDLSPLLPPDVPTRLELMVALDAQHIPIVGPTARADPILDNTTWYTGSWRQVDPGHYVLDATLKRSDTGTFGIVLEAYAAANANAPEVPYSLQATATAHPEWIPPHVPVALAAAADDVLRFESPNEEDVELLVYGDDDRLLDRLYLRDAHDWPVPVDAQSLVVVAMGSDGGVRILRTASEDPGELAALDLVRERGEVHPVAPRAETTWSFDVAPRPLRVVVTVTGPGGSPWTCAGTLAVALMGPEEPLLERVADCPSPTNVPFLYEETRSWTTELGDARLTPGSYTVRLDNSLWTGHQSFHTVERYVR